MNDWLSQPRGHLHKRQQPSCHNLHVQLGLYTLYMPPALYSPVQLYILKYPDRPPHFPEVPIHRDPKQWLCRNRERESLQHTISSCAVASPQYTAVLPEYTFKGLHFSPKTS